MKTSKHLKSVKGVVQFAFGVPLTILTVFFIGKILFSAKTEITRAVFSMNIPVFLLGVVCILLFFVLKSLVWLQIARKVGVAGEAHRLLYVYAFAEIRRYIPGSIFSFASRIRGLHTEQIQTSRTVSTIFIEAIVLVASASIIALPALVFLENKLLWFLPFTNSMVPILTTACIGFFVLFCFSYRWTFHKLSLIGAFIRKYSLSFFTALLGWILFGLGNYLIAVSLTFLTPIHFVLFVSLFVFSWLIGYLFFVSPMGLGVREGMIVFSLTLFAPLSVVALIAILSRIGILLAEILSLIVFSSYKKFCKSVFIQKLNGYMIMLSCFVAAFITYFVSFTLLRHANYASGRFDLGNMAQTVWNTFHGHVFVLTNPDGINPISRLGIHADFLLILLAPFYLLWEHPGMLLIIQTVVIGLGAYFVFGIGKNVLKNNGLALALSISYLFNFYIQEQTVFDFHSVALASTFLLGASYYFIKKRYALLLLFLGLSVLTKEEIYLISGLFGVALFYKGKRLWGVLLTVCSFLAFYLLMAKFIPAARGHEHFALAYLSYLGDSPSSIIATAILKPYLLIPVFFNQATFTYYAQLLSSTGYLALFSPIYLFFALPDVLINTLSANPGLRSYDYHYDAAIVPFLYLAAIFGAKKLLSQKLVIIPPRMLLTYILVTTIYTSWSTGLLPYSRTPDFSGFIQQDKHKLEIARALKTIPDNAAVASTNNIGAHLSHRKDIYVLPYGVELSDYIVIYREHLQIAQQLKTRGDFALIKELPNFYIFKKN